MKAAAIVTIPISTAWNWLRDLVIRRELSGAAGIEYDVEVQVMEGDRLFQGRQHK